jgi:DNA (cytosine-5)-methyltransferase 1
MTPILANTYFSGAGLMDIGLQAGGLTLQQSFEIEAVCCDTQRRNFAHEVIQCDITKKLVQSEKECHVMVATYPCTKYSPMADIHGAHRGRFVPAFLSARDYPQARALRRRECSGHEEIPRRHGSNDETPGLLRTCSLSGQIFDLAAAKRDRLIIIGSRRTFSWREPAAERTVTLAEILEPDPAPHIPDYVGRRLAGQYRDRPIISDPKHGDLAPTCVAHYAKDLSTRLVADGRFPRGARPYTVREYARLQGVPDTFSFAGGDNDAYRMIGNGVSVPVGKWIGTEITRYFQ